MEAGSDFEFFERMLPEPTRAQVRRIQLFTLARMVSNIAACKQELEEIGTLSDTQITWATW